MIKEVELWGQHSMGAFVKKLIAIAVGMSMAGQSLTSTREAKTSQ
jgi:hypothetical protein